MFKILHLLEYLNRIGFEVYEYICPYVVLELLTVKMICSKIHKRMAFLQYWKKENKIVSEIEFKIQFCPWNHLLASHMSCQAWRLIKSFSANVTKMSFLLVMLFFVQNYRVPIWEPVKKKKNFVKLLLH